MDNTKTPEQGPALLQILGLWDSIALIIGIVIGVGIFRVPSEVAKYLPSPGLVLFAWLAGGLFSLIGASCYSELSSSFPETGGDYVYLKKSYGPLWGFLYGWTSLLVTRTGAIAAVAFIFAEYLVSFLSLDRSFVKLTAISVVLLLSVISIAGLREGKRLQNISTIAKVLTLGGIIILGFSSGKGDMANFYPTPFPAGRNLLSMFGLALVPILWTYGGWHENTYVTGETKDAQKVLPRALMTGTLIITVLYLFMNLVYIYLVPLERIAGSELIASDVMQILFGKWAQKAVEALVLISAFGAINGMIITSSRITFAMAEDNAVFRCLGKVDARFCTPARSIITNTAWIVILIAWGTFTKLIFFTGVLIWLYFALIIIGVFVLRRKYPGAQKHYKVWGYPVTPAIYALVCIWLAVNIAFHYPAQSLAGICLMLIGIPVYAVSKRLSAKPRS